MCLGCVLSGYLRHTSEVFFCDDQSISHPYKPSTISTLVLAVVGIGLPVIVILIIEGIHTSNKKKHGTLEPPYPVGNTRFPNFVYQCYKNIGIFLFGAAVNLTVTNIGKYSVGRLRPHFLDVCKPDYSLFSCTDERGFQRYITEDVCTGTEAKKIKEMRLSFPSGHASLAMYCMVFLALYIYARFTWKGSKLLSPLLQVSVIFLAIYTCFSRISDYKHHWSDVLAGAFIGTLVACLTVSRVKSVTTWGSHSRLNANEHEYYANDFGINYEFNEEGRGMLLEEEAGLERPSAL